MECQMPLERAEDADPILDFDIHSLRFPMRDESGKVPDIIWVQLSTCALKEHAGQSSVDERDRQSMFEQYRAYLEDIASKVFDKGNRLSQESSTFVLYLTNGDLV
jgi:hypothetical protein